MSSITEFYREECEKIDPSDINAYFELHLKDIDPGILQLETSWNDTETDLGPAIKARETNTHLFLSPVENPVALQYNRERGDPDCINGEDLARIIPMTKLKDVDQSKPIQNGNVYVYNDGVFQPFDLMGWKQEVDNRLTKVENRLTQIENRLTVIEEIIKRPDGVPDDTRICYGNINLYSDYSNSDNRYSGLYTHDIQQNKTNDEYFA